MQISKKWFFMCAIVFSILFSQAVFAADDVRVFYKGAEIYYDVPPQIMHGRTMVPLRATVETITGQEMQWDGPTMTVTFTANGHINKHTIGEKVVYVDGVPITFDTPSLIVNQRTLVPVRMIAETSGCSVDWDGANRFVLITPPATPQPVPQPTPVAQPTIDTVSASRTSIAPGEAVDLTIRTNSAANYVWVSVGSGSFQATYKSSDTSGHRTWTVTVKPSSTGNITVYANVNQSSSGAATKAQYITVESALSIYSISPSRTNITQGDSVTFTIRTSLTANNVWVEYDNTNVNASFIRQENSSEETWSVTFYPRETQSVRVYANTSRTTSGAASDTQRITVSQPYNPPATVSIINAYPSKSSYSTGERVTVTMTTNSAANYAWVDAYDAEYPMSGGGSDSSGNRTWTASFYLASSQNITVYASNSSQYGTDASKSVMITFSGGAPQINYIETEDTNYSPNQTVRVTLYTNANVTSVDFEHDLGEFDSISNYTTQDNQRVWRWDFKAPGTSTGVYLRIYAAAYGAGGGPAQANIQIFVEGLDLSQ